MQHKFTPKICEGAEAEYEGTITLRMPTADERMELIDELKETVGETSSEEAVKEDLKNERKNRHRMRLAMRKVPDFFISADIKRKSDGFVFDTFEKLNYDSDMIFVIQECAGKIIGKYSVSDPS